VFGQVDGQPGNGLGAYHYDGSHWTRVAGPSVQGGSALSDHDVWLGHQTSVGHWDGHAWRRTSLAALLPHGVGILGVLAESPADVYAVADVSYASMVVLRYDGRSWSKVAAGAFGVMAEQVAPMAGDGRGGLWFIGNGSVPGSLLAHYSAGRLATFPATTAAGKAPLMFTIAQAGGEVLAGGYAQDSPFRPRTGLILRYAG
ncbi:MAG TPA: hypothetical protein VKU39_19365, partial [Streptosporangiaceae bacterium]|nr:hypothetical protein [Streptosporangiaceae bacterium]